MSLIYELDTEVKAQALLDAINGLAEQYWEAAGYTVINNELVGKKNGIDNTNAARTVSWDVVSESPDGTWYFTSLSNDERFKDGTQQLRDAGFTFTEKEFPDSWVLTYGEV